MQLGVVVRIRRPLGRVLGTASLAAVAFLLYTGLGSGAEVAQAAPCDPPVQNPIVCENSKPGNPQSEWDISGGGDPSIQGFATDISVNLGRDGPLQDRHPVDRLSPRHLPDGLLRRRRRPQGRHRHTLGEPAADPARLPDRRSHRAVRLRQLGGVRLLGGAGRRRLGHLLRQARPRRPALRREPHLLHRPRRRQPLRPPLPDLGHHLAGLQPVRRQEPLHRTRAAGTNPDRAYKVSYNRP